MASSLSQHFTFALLRNYKGKKKKRQRKGKNQIKKEEQVEDFIVF